MKYFVEIAAAYISDEDLSTRFCHHAIESKHSFNAKIFVYENNDKNRKIREAIEIRKKNNNAYNFTNDIYKVSGIYSPKIDRLHIMINFFLVHLASVLPYFFSAQFKTSVFRAFLK